MAYRARMTEPRTAFASLNIANPLVAWLVYRGEMVSGGQAHESTLNFWLMRALSAEASAGHRGVLFQNELLLEARRAQHHPEAVSRLRGFYVFDEKTSAQAGIKDWGKGFDQDYLAQVGILPDSRISRHDAQWITHHLALGGPKDWMDRYLRGEPRGAQPIWELLVEGRALVYGTTLRKAAYDVVKRTWPDSMALLELSRLGVELNSDIGLIAPMLLGHPDDLRVDFTMSFADAKNPDFLGRLSAFGGPKNTNDLGPDSNLVVPDLRRHGFKLS
jgi:hypothetical protein